jgi:hypothetical protein
MMIKSVCAVLAMMSVLVPAAANANPAVTLFKVVTVKDEIVIGLTASELSALGGTDAGAVAKAIARSGELTVWQYAVRKAQNGDLQQAPLHRVGILANTSLRVEPYATPLPIVAP